MSINVFKKLPGDKITASESSKLSAQPVALRPMYVCRLYVSIVSYVALVSDYMSTLFRYNLGSTEQTIDLAVLPATEGKGKGKARYLIQRRLTSEARTSGALTTVEVVLD